MLPGGRRRRYFGYPRDLAGVVDTPDSAKSYASLVSPITSSTKVKVTSGKCFKPDKPLPKRFADRYLHSAIAAQIPALLLPLQNTFRFNGYQDNPMKLHCPHFQHNHDITSRSLFYIWLAKNDRSELYDIVEAHLGNRGEKGNRFGEANKIAGNNGHQKLTQADYTGIPRTLSVLDDDTSQTSKNAKSKFHKGTRDGLKTPRDRFMRDHGARSAAIDAICHIYPGSEKTRVTEKDVQECILAAKLLLGPYAGINTAFTSPNDIPAEILEMIEEEDRLERQNGTEQKEVGTVKRPFGYNSSQVKYEKKILAAMEYYNQIKSGTPNVTPPPEVFTKPGQQTQGKSQADIHHAVSRSQATITRPDKSVADLHRRSEMGVHGHGHNNKRKFNKDHITEEDYMDMYVHWVGSNEDLGTRQTVGSMTDISKLRRKLHLDYNPEEQKDAAAIEDLLKNDSFSDIADPVSRRILKGKFDPLVKSELTESDLNLVRNMLFQQSNKVPSPKIKARMRQLGFIMGRKSEPTSLDMSAASSSINLEETDSEKLEYAKFEKEMGFLERNINEFIEEGLGLHGMESRTDANSSDTELSTGPDGSIELHGCSMMDLECLSQQGALGPPPFTSSKSKLVNNLHKHEDRGIDVGEQMPETNIFAKEHWIKEASK